MIIIDVNINHQSALGMGQNTLGDHVHIAPYSLVFVFIILCHFHFILDFQIPSSKHIECLQICKSSPLQISYILNNSFSAHNH